MTMTPEPFDTPKKRSGFRVFLYVLFTLMGLLVLTCGAGVYFLTQTEQGKKIVEAVGETTVIAEAAMKAPGTDELRALGCDTAMVMQLSDFAEMLEAITPDDALPAGTEDALMVICQLGILGGDPPTCQEVADTYIAAAAPNQAFAVNVSKKTGNSVCDVEFTADGRPLEPAE